MFAGSNLVAVSHGSGAGSAGGECVSGGRQRAISAARIGVTRRAGKTVLGRLHQSGSLRLRLPRETSASAPTAVLLNTAGGVAGGDSLSLDVVCGAATSLTVTTQGAERLYRALPSDPASRIVTSIDLADGACCDFLPQETILFDRCSLDRQLAINMTGSARFLGIEALIFGRAAMGETVQTARLRDSITLTCDGVLRFHEVFRPPGQVAAWRQRPTALGGATAMATILLACSDAGERLVPLRDALASFQMGASAWDGLLVGRIVAADGAELRRALLASMSVLRQGRAMPRVWSC